jgi:type I restriction enzyme S subunit
MSKQSNIPQLRFKGFEGEFLFRKLGDISNVVMGQSPDSKSYNENGEGLYLIQGNADIKNRVSYPRQWTNNPTKVCEVGDLILTVRAPVGAVAKSIHNACIGRGVCAIRNLNQYSIEYIYQFLLDFETKWGNLEQGSTFTAVSGNDIKSIKIPIPNLPEQEKIASFLSSVDEKIRQLTRKATLLEQYKKGVMQQLFSGKLRFKDENGEEYSDWEFKKMNEIFSFKQGIQCGVESQFFEKSENMERFIRIIDLTSDKEAPRFIANQDKGNVILEDDLFMVRYGVPGLVGYGYNGIIANNLFRLIPKKNICSKFYYYVLTHLNKDIMTLSSSTTMPALNFSSLGALKIPSINIQEQQKIAEFLSGIDEKIGVVRGELLKMQGFKKGLLQQMFV